MIRAHTQFVAASLTNQFLYNVYVSRLAKRQHYLGLLNYFVDFLQCTNKLGVQNDKRLELNQSNASVKSMVLVLLSFYFVYFMIFVNIFINGNEFS